MNYALDACSIIAYLRAEPGGDFVRSILNDADNTCYAHALNMVEVFYDTVRISDEATAEKAVQDLIAAGVVIRQDMDEPFWKDVAGLKAPHRISLADCCCLALARRVGGEVVTSDHREFDPLAPLNLCPIQFIR